MDSKQIRDEHCCGDHPIDQLHREHAVIVRVLDAIGREVAAMRAGGSLSYGFWLRTLEFLDHYADRCHHGKEEELLFVELERAGMGHGHGPLACLRAEHEVGRAGRAQMLGALRGNDRDGLGHVATAYAEQLRQHIDKEDHVLFPLALELLDDAAIARLRAGFAAHERALGEDTHARCQQLAHELGTGSGLAAAP